MHYLADVIAGSQSTRRAQRLYAGKAHGRVFKRSSKLRVTTSCRCVPKTQTVILCESSYPRIHGRVLCPPLSAAITVQALYKGTKDCSRRLPYPYSGPFASPACTVSPTIAHLPKACRASRLTGISPDKVQLVLQVLIPSQTFAPDQSNSR